METTEGCLLGGRVRYAQPRAGFRSGIEPVLLAAAVPARPGELVLEAGTGAGAALLCLAARVPGIAGLGVERDAVLAALARRNLAANGYAALTVLEADIEALPPTGLFAHACANPPYHAASGTPSPLAAREAAKRAGPGLLTAWSGVLAARLSPGGTLTLILPAAAVPAAMAALQSAGCAATTALPLWPKTGRAAKLVLLRGRKGGRAPFRLLAGLTLHRDDGGFTKEAEAILRDGAALAL